MFSCKDYFHFSASWLGFPRNIGNNIWSDIYNSPNLIDELNSFQLNIINRRTPAKITHNISKGKSWFHVDCFIKSSMEECFGSCFLFTLPICGQTLEITSALYASIVYPSCRYRLFE